MFYNYSRLLGRIVECYGTRAKLATAMGLSERSLSLKLNNKLRFKQNEIDVLCELLNIPKDQIGAYFFTPDVQFA